ncbi:MAG: class I SAM-dependent methyltransferase [Humidesulfovibrio sp.]|nr:class I SAM-dependent methyltransferase [Humidesulfovibrio sp.]
MFRNIPQAIEVTQGHLKALAAWRNAQGVEARRVVQVSPEAGKLLAILLAGCPAGDAAELGTGGGLSALWLALACRATGRRLTTFELDPNRAELARQSLSAADVLDVVDLREGDGLKGLEALPELAFCFLDADPGKARAAYELALARLKSGGLVCVALPPGTPLNVLADNKPEAGSPMSPTPQSPGQADFRRFLFDAEMDARVDAVILPVGAGLLVCRKT